MTTVFPPGFDNLQNNKTKVASLLNSEYFLTPIWFCELLTKIMAPHNLLHVLQLLLLLFVYHVLLRLQFVYLLLLLLKMTLHVPKSGLLCVGLYVKGWLCLWFPDFLLNHLGRLAARTVLKRSQTLLEILYLRVYLKEPNHMTRRRQVILQSPCKLWLSVWDPSISREFKLDDNIL